MKKIFTLGLAFLALTLLPQFASAQNSPSKEEVKKESKEVKEATEKIKKEEKEVKKKAVKMTDSGKQSKAVKEEKEKAKKVKVKKNEPRPYISHKIEQPKNKEPKQQQKVNKVKDQKPY